MFFLLALLLTMSQSTHIYAISDFTTNQKIEYNFDVNGNSQVTHQLEITNNISQLYPKEYKTSINGVNLINLRAFDSNGGLTPILKQSDNTQSLSIPLPNSKVGKNQITNFTFQYQTNTLAKQKGKTWEISLPQFQDEFDTKTLITIITPNAFGKISSSPKGSKISTDQNTTTTVFEVTNNHEKIIVTTGEHQLFDFSLSYFIKNSSNQKGEYSIPIPPDSANQKITFTQIEPLPNRIETDNDDNWIAIYQLDPNTSQKILVSGQAKIGQNQAYYSQSLPIFSNQLYWPTDNSEIKSLAQKYATPRQIYDYVVSQLDYDYQRYDNSARRGAVTALNNPKSSICTDFTDLFITIARAAGIGAREVEGYAYSNNNNAKPVPTGTDILHAWPEYFDNTSKSWIPIDPTWAKTTGGVNYFDDLDLNHLAFVIHNQSADSPPPPGSYKSNTAEQSITVKFADNEVDSTIVSPIVNLEFNFWGNSTISIKNPNLISLDNLSIFGQKQKNLAPLEQITIPAPKQSFISSLMPQNQKISIPFAYNNVETQYIYIQNPHHFVNLLITIVLGLILLSIGAIILLRKK